MLKRKIKIILIGLFSLFFLGLMYSLFSTKAEIISDESLRIEEPVIPGLESQLERAEKASMSRSVLKDDGEVELSLEGEPVAQPLAEIASDLSESSLNEPVNPFADGVITDSDAAEFKNVDALELAEEQESNATITSGADFLDLNEATPTKPEVVLTKSDQLILDEINQSLSQYKLNDSKAEEVANDDETIELSPVELAASEESQLSEDATVSDDSPKRPSVFASPEVDESLMQGDDEISQQYRVTMSKLISINAELRAADQENAELRTQFEISVSQNRQMAQIIRDIDNQIKVFTSTN